MEFLVFCHEHIHGHCQRGQLGGGDRQPHAVKAPEGGQEEQCGHLEQKRAQKGDECARHAGAQRREEGGRIDVEALDEEAQRIYNLLDELKADTGKTYLLVAHNGIARVVHSYFYDMTNEEYAAAGIKNCQLVEYTFE